MKELRFSEVVKPLTELLQRFGPYRKVQHPEYPFWRLQRDNVWEVHGIHEFNENSEGAVGKVALLRGEAIGQFTHDVLVLLNSEPGRVIDIARRLLNAHFPPSLHQEICDAVGLVINEESDSGGGRDPDFRKKVLIAYEHHCAVCGLQLLLSGLPVALEAAHIRWHQAGGPSVLPNGICLCVLHHKLFDRGAFTIVNQGTILVSEEISGHFGLNEHLLSFHGQLLRKPIRSNDAPSEEFTHWHRREVFRGSPRPH